MQFEFLERYHSIGQPHSNRRIFCNIPFYIRAVEVYSLQLHLSYNSSMKYKRERKKERKRKRERGERRGRERDGLLHSLPLNARRRSVPRDAFSAAVLNELAFDFDIFGRELRPTHKIRQSYDVVDRSTQVRFDGASLANATNISTREKSRARQIIATTRRSLS